MTTTLKRERLAQSIERMKEKAEQMRLKSLSELKKQELINKYYTQHGVYLTQKQLETKYKNIDDRNLEIILERKHRYKRQVDAAIVIQKNYKARMVRKAYLKIQRVRLNAALIVQRFFMNFRRRNILPKLIIQLKEKSATTI